MINKPLNKILNKIKKTFLSTGGAIINGDLYVDLEPAGMDDPSMAIFSNISFDKRNYF